MTDKPSDKPSEKAWLDVDDKQAEYVRQSAEQAWRSIERGEAAAALPLMRVAAEAVCKHLHERNIGPAGDKMLDGLARDLVKNGALPKDVGLLVGTVQAFGNYAAHAQPTQRIADDVALGPPKAALEGLLRWYFRDVVHRPLDPPWTRKAAATRSRAPLVAAAAGVVVVAVVGVVAYAHPFERPVKSAAAAATTPAAPTATSAASVATATKVAPTTTTRGLAEPASTASAQRGDLELTFTALRIDGDNEVPIDDGAVLRTGDKIAFAVTTSQAAHVYIAQGSTILFPNKDMTDLSNPLMPSTRVRIPQLGAFRVNAEDIGDEVVLIAASMKPIPSVTAMLNNTKKRPRLDNAIGALVDDCPTKKSDGTCSTRGLVLDVERSQSRGFSGSTTRTMAALAGDDVVAARFHFKHER